MQLLHFSRDRCGGTMGAVVTCPLEVVKTRLQSSSYGYMGNALPPPAAQQGGSTTCPTVPQRHRGGSTRRLCTSALRSGTQVVQLSQQLPDPQGQRHSLSLFRCLKLVNSVYFWFIHILVWKVEPRYLFSILFSIHTVVGFLFDILLFFLLESFDEECVWYKWL